MSSFLTEVVACRSVFFLPFRVHIVLPKQNQSRSSMLLKQHGKATQDKGMAIRGCANITLYGIGGVLPIYYNVLQFLRGAGGSSQNITILQ